jgi:hypothetical protein
MMFPERVVEENRHKFQGTSMFGVSITELSKDELMAAIIVMGNLEQEQRKSMKSEREMMASLRTERRRSPFSWLGI